MKMYMSNFLVVIFLLICFPSCAFAQSSNLTIDRKVQQARDDDRRLILRTELQAEYQELSKAKSALSNVASAERAAAVHRRSENIKALERELTRVGAQQSAQAYVPPVFKVKHQILPSAARSASGSAAFWNPYNRTPDPETSTDFSTTPRRNTP